MKGFLKTIVAFFLIVLLTSCAAQQAMLDKQAQDRQAAIDLKIQNDKEQADALKAKRAAAQAKRQAAAEARAERAAAARAPLTTPVIPQLPVAVHLPAATAPAPAEPVGAPVKAAPTQPEKKKLESPTAQAKPKHDYEKMAALAQAKAKRTSKIIAAKKHKSTPHPIAKNVSKKSPSVIAKKAAKLHSTVATNKRLKTPQPIVASNQVHTHKELASNQSINKQKTIATHKSAAIKKIVSAKQAKPHSIATSVRHDKNSLPIVAKKKPTKAENHLMQAQSHATAKQKQLAKASTKIPHLIATTDKHKVLAKNTEHKAIPAKTMNS